MISSSKSILEQIELVGRQKKRPLGHEMKSNLSSMNNLFQTTLDTPWRAANELRRVMALPYIRLLFWLHGIRWGPGWRIYGMPIIQRWRGSQIHIGRNVSLRSWYSTNPLAPNHPVVLATRSAGAVIRIGDDCGFTGTTLVAAEHIAIGNRVAVGANVTITDTDFHPLDPAERQRDFLAGRHAPVIIEDDVFIGMQSLILKGVTIGQGSVIGAGSVVTDDVTSGTIVAGNPARRLRHVSRP
jgi:acetyltransferase-like isoleucine patch superfamily enzyme